AAPAGEPAAAPGLQGHASLVGEIKGVCPPIGGAKSKSSYFLTRRDPSEDLRRLKNGPAVFATSFGGSLGHALKIPAHKFRNWYMGRKRNSNPDLVPHIKEKGKCLGFNYH